MSDKMRIEEQDDVIVITCKGDLDAFYAEEFKEKALASVADKEKDILFDASELTYIDSTGLGALIAIYNVQRQKGRGLKVIHVPETVEKLFRITRLNEVFGIGEKS